MISQENSFYHSVKAPVPEAFKKARPEESVRATTALAYLLLGEPVSLVGGLEFPADPLQEAWGKRWAPVIEELVAKDKVKPHPPIVVPGGLEAIPGVLENIAQGGTRGKKTVISIV